MNCFTWINGVPVHVDIRWISCEEFHLILFHFCFISGGYHVIVEHRFPPYVYSTCVFNFLIVLGGLSVYVIIHVSLYWDGYYVW